MTVATQLISIFNKKYNEEPEPEIPNTKYNSLFLQKHPLVEQKIYSLPFYKSVNIPSCNYICRMKYIHDVNFVKKIMELRLCELRKKLVYVKYHIELYKLLIISIQREKNLIQLEKLKSRKFKLMQWLIQYILIDDGEYIIDTTLSTYLFLKTQYKFFFKNNSKYFIYD